MRTLLTALGFIVATSTVATASSTFTYDFEGVDDGITLVLDGDTMATVVDGNSGSCGPLTGNATSFLCLTGDGGPDANGSVWSFDGLSIPANANSLTISFDIAGDSEHNGGADILEGTGSRWVDFVLINDGSKDLVSLDGSYIESNGENGKWITFDEPINSFATGSNYTLGVRVSGDGNEFVGLDNITFTAGVPEPSTWLMMLAGFALVGATLQRRKGIAAAA